jgi:hypothetical protein
MARLSCDSRETLARLAALDTVSSRSHLGPAHGAADRPGAPAAGLRPC